MKTAYAPIAVSGDKSYVAPMRNGPKFSVEHAVKAQRAGLLPGCPGAAPLHDHALLPWRFHPLLHAADGIL